MPCSCSKAWSEEEPRGLGAQARGLGAGRARHLNGLRLGLALGWLLGPGLDAAQPLAPGALPEPWMGSILRLRLEIAPADWQRLRDDPRQDVPATFYDGDQVYSGTTVHLKGRTGSFRKVDDRPALTLRFDKIAIGGRWRGLTKIHLNNSVEDGTYLCEALGAELFAEAGLPAARVAHAFVELNGRHLGLYVLKEGFTKEFLARSFHRSDGVLYEPVPVGPGRIQLREAVGHGPDDGADWRALASAAETSDLRARWSRLQGILDVEEFLSFMALEVMMVHRDGYCLAANNYRMYHDPETERMVFLPHGMDQLFVRADLRLQPSMQGPVARSLMELPEVRRQYRRRAAFLYTNLFEADALGRRVERLAGRIRPELAGTAAREWERQVLDLKRRVVARSAFLGREFAGGDRVTLRFTNGLARPSGWREVDVPAGGRLDRATAPDGLPSLHIQAGPSTSASWRSTVLLGAGRYRFAGRARTAGVRPLRFGRNKGAGLRVSVAPLPEPHHLIGDAGWTSFAVDFEVRAEELEVELICELRAREGEVWFDVGSLRLTQLE